MSNLHAVWDSVAYEWTGFPVQPFSAADWSWYTETSQAIAGSYKVDKSLLYDGDFSKWAQEGYDISTLYVYPGKFKFQIGINL